jgi:hypothetical protein
MVATDDDAVTGGLEEVGGSERVCVCCKRDEVSSMHRSKLFQNVPLQKVLGGGGGHEVLGGGEQAQALHDGPGQPSLWHGQTLVNMNQINRESGELGLNSTHLATDATSGHIFLSTGSATRKQGVPQQHGREAGTHLPVRPHPRSRL